MMAYLIITNGLDQGRLFRLSAGQNILGHDEHGQLQVSLEAIGRQHARLLVSNGHVVIEELSNSDDTYVNGALVQQPFHLHHGDQIQIAEMELRFYSAMQTSVSQANTNCLEDFASTATVATLRERSNLLRRLRQFFYDAGFDEVETPTLSADTVVDRYLHPIQVEIGGKPYWLQTSPEFGMKRLLASGMKSIFQVGRAYRDEEQGPLHNLEFTMVEWYRVGDTTQQAMQFLGELITELLAFESFEQITYQQAFQKLLDFDPLEISDQDLMHVIAALDMRMSPTWQSLARTDWLDLLLTEFIQPQLGLQKPCILYEYPASQSALARIHPDNPLVAERFELYVHGIELANGYHELLDANELYERNLKTNALRQSDNRPVLPVDSYLAKAMKHGLPDCCGVALGFDRLAMIALNKNSITEVLPFPFPRA